jgi:DNA-binding response OmpR family regulator
MKDHNGEVFVTSGKGGTSFDLYFPKAEEKASTSNGLPQPATLQGHGEKILVVDDEPQQCDLARRILEHYGYDVECSPSGEEAIDYLKNQQADLIILDMMMAPGINGRQTYERIKEIHPDQKAIIASGFSESEDITATLNMGAGIFIKKPYSIQELVGSVKNELLK